MRIPRRGPLLRVGVNGMEEQMVDEPDVLRSLRLKAVAVFEVQEEKLPLAAESSSDIIPQSLDASVINAETT